MNWTRKKVTYLALITIVTLAITFLSRNFALLIAIAPTAYFLSVNSGEDVTAEGLFVSHLLATTAGLVAYFTFASGIDPWAVDSRSREVLRLILSVASAMLVTGVGLRLVDEKISTAYATTSVVALGVITSPLGLSMLIVWITLISGIHAAFARLDSLA